MWCIKPFLDLFLARLFSKHILLTVHNVESHTPHIFETYTNRLIFSIPDKLVTVSKFNYQKMLNDYSISPKDTVLLPHGPLYLPKSGRVFQPESLKNDVIKTICFFGSVKSYKGVNILLDCASEVQSLGLTIEIWGKWSAAMTARVANFEQNGIKVVNKFLSNEEIYQLMCREILFVLPYKSSSQSGVASLLLAYNKPFIVSRSGENYRLFKEHGLEEACFEPNNKAAFIDSVSFAHKNNCRIKMKLRQVREEYCWSKTHSRDIITSLYKD